MLSKLFKYICLILFSVVITILIQLHFVNLTNDIDNFFLDTKFRFKELCKKNYLRINKFILIANDDDFTRQKLNYAPLTLYDWNKYLAKLENFQTKTIAFYTPLYFPNKEDGENSVFLNFLKNNSNLVIPCILDNKLQINNREIEIDDNSLFHKVDGIEKTNPLKFTKISLPFDQILRETKFIGFSNLVPDNDGVIRKIPLLASYNGKVIFSFTLLTLMNFLDIDLESLKINHHFLILDSKKYKKSFRIPLTEQNEMYVYLFDDLRNKFRPILKFQNPYLLTPKLI